RHARAGRPRRYAARHAARARRRRGARRRAALASRRARRFARARWRARGRHDADPTEIPRMNEAVLSEIQKSAVLARLRSIPIYATLAFEILDAREGSVSMKVPRDKRYDGIFESFHGGILMTAADSAAAFAVLTVAGADAKITTTDMSIRFLAKCLTDVCVEA